MSASLDTVHNSQENALKSSLPSLFPNLLENELQILEEMIQNNKINLPLLRKFCYQDNLVNCPKLRPLFWRLLLGYLPLEVSAWSEVSTLNKSLYQEYISEFFIKNDENYIPEDSQTNSFEQPLESNPEENKERTTITDHPLNVGKDSNWMTHFKNKELWNNIEKDTKRTRADDIFFSQMAKKKYPSLSKNDEDTKKKEQEGMETHREVMTRILFVFAKTHNYIKYVQGMNELLAPIYYCFSQNKDKMFEENIEEDSFTCFSLLMSEIKENFTKIKDCSLLGFKTRIMLLDRLLKKVDPKLWQHLTSFHVMTEIYSMKWILLLLTQDFNIQSIMRIWDVLFSYQDKQEFVNFLSLAMIINARDEIMKGSFEEIHLVLRKVANVRLEKILELADNIAREYNDIENC